MAKQTINHGTTAGDKTGESLFSAFGKVNDNFTELYGAKTEFVANAAALPAEGEAGKIYVASDTGVMYRWLGGAYIASFPELLRNAGGHIIGMRDPEKGNLLTFGGWIDVREHGAKCDGKVVYDATASNSAASAIGSVTAVFTAADVGKACAILPYTDVGTSTLRWGTITSVIDANNVVTSLSGSPGALTGATFIWGTDDSVAIDAALTAANAAPFKQAVFFPVGITCSTKKHTIPMGCAFTGVMNNPTGGKAKDFKHYGSSLVLLKFLSDKFIVAGSSGSDPKGCRITNMNIDSFMGASQCVYSSGRTLHVNNATLVRGLSEVLNTGPTGRVHHCCILGHNIHNVVQVGGDGTITDNIITGAGNGYFGVKCSNGDDVLILGNHIWKDSSLTSLLGGAIWLSHNSGNVVAGSITVANNKLDTSYGPQIKVSVTGNSIARGINIIGNHAFQNSAVPDATYPYMELAVEAGSSIRGLTVQGNTGRGAWDDAAQARYTYFIDATIAGNVYGSNIGGNTIDNCDAMFNGITPDHDSGNITIAGTGTVLTKSVTT